MENQPPAIFRYHPVLAVSQNRRSHPGSARLDHRQAIRLLWPHDYWHAPFDDPGLFTRDFGQRIAQILLMVDGYRGDNRQRRVIHHVGGVQPPTKPDLQQDIIGLHPGKGQKCRRRGNLKKRDVVRPIGLHAFIQQGGQSRFGNQCARQTDSFMKPCQMRRGIGMHRAAPRLKPRADHGLGAALAIGSGNMNNRRQEAFGMAKRRQQPFHPPHGQINHLGMQRHHALQNGVRAGLCRHHTFASAITPGGGRSPLIAGVWFISMRRIVTNSSRRSLRWVTRSNMP